MVANTGGKGQQARFWETGTGKAMGQPMTHAGEVHSLAFTPNGD
jgi:hypothetical protein